MKLTAKLLKEMVRKELRETTFAGKESYMARHLAPELESTPEAELGWTPEEEKAITSIMGTLDQFYDEDGEPYDPGVVGKSGVADLINFTPLLATLYPYDPDGDEKIMKLWAEAYKRWW